MNKPNLNPIQGVLLLNLATLIMSTSGVIAKHMALFPPFVVWMRCFIGYLTLGILLALYNRKFILFPFRNYKLIISGILLCIHWVAFFYSIHYSTVAIAAVAVFTYPIFTTLIEPLFTKSKLERFHLFLGVIVFIGIWIISPKFSLQNETFIGVLFGIISAIAYAVRNIISKDIVIDMTSKEILYHQLFIVMVLLIPFANYHEVEVVSANLFPLLILGIIPTVLGHGLLVESFKYFSSSKAAILTSVQPLYAIVLAMIFLNEYPHSNVYFGGIIIVSTVILEVIRKSKS